ncbi:BamA/TamA family outer membrane protein [Alloacidobacterium dinghuense]|uniref:BamA/TamA family outer membrane protein n=1 Tax=Alloacidobacterium dinghuense TaxID=2763107 RepID=A0A7G8BM49_9BACT|nr:POTRA domain-containing protein [Alloacidobacterium dinghuense]QNI33619.1 BamA/TamA family outer membrane protein [Alloacidobacterium dinghuense]
MTARDAAQRDITLRSWAGLQVEAVQFKGIPPERLAPLPESLALQPHQPLDPLKVRDSLRRLYETGLYKTIVVEGLRHGDAVTIIFSGVPNLFIGRITVNGINNERLSGVLERSTRMNAGTVFNDAKFLQAQKLLQETLEENGFYQSKIFASTAVDSANSQVNIVFEIVQGKQARVGAVAVQGDSGMTIDSFRKKGKLKEDSKVSRDTVSNALSRLRKNYQKQNRLEASLKLDSHTYQPPVNHLDYGFSADRGPLVVVLVEGASLSKGKIRNLVPVYEEGAVDEDLLNEGDRRIRDYYQRAGYFNVKVTHDEQLKDKQHSIITFTVSLGMKHEVASVTVNGNKYFGTDTILPRLSVVKSSIVNRHGMYSQALAQADVNAITALYQSNGFSNVKVTPEVKDADVNTKGKKTKDAQLSVNYTIDEGAQQRIGAYVINGASKVQLSDLTPLLNTQSGQPYSSLNITQDRDSILTFYLSHGFDNAQINLLQRPSPKDPNLIDVTMNVTEGDQFFVNRVLISGLHYTRPSTVEDRVLIHPGDPLNQTALLETQRKLYDLTLFNQVNTAVQNPLGDELRKNVLLQFTEARRWDISYGFGFQAQTGNPQSNCANLTPQQLIQLGINPSTYTCSPNGKTGVSPAVLFNISRINIRGTDKSVSLNTTLGTLEQRILMSFSNPHFLDKPKLNLILTGGYTNAQDVTTYASSRLEGTIRLTDRVNKPNTLIYSFGYRRVKVDPNSVQVAPDEIPLVSEPVRVGGPGITWIRDTRVPTPLDATSGTFTTVIENWADSHFASQADFNRIDGTNSSYYKFGKLNTWVVARNTRIAAEHSYGGSDYNLVPLPERLYAGGAQSHRGFGINAAGPRDSLTGFPIGGTGAFINNTELRMPNPMLPYVGNSLGFVLFEDMGNVFEYARDIWPSFTRFRQPNRDGCRNLNEQEQSVPHPGSPISAAGLCSFNYFSHAVGIGLRYHTPVGPIRLDFSYNLNPPIYPVIIDYSSTPTNPIPAHVGEAGHFNFFFSIGQAF